MRGSLILRLVDITLLLLLSLMAATSITSYGTEPPVTFRLEDKGTLPVPMAIAITSDGTYVIQGKRPVDAAQLGQLLAVHRADIVFLADAQAPAVRLMAAHRMARAAGRRAAFIVQRKEGGQP